jgi:acyl carrier protein
MTTTESEVYRQVQQIVAEELAVAEDDVVPDARLTEDLGAESIDYLAIQFRVEKTFGFKVEPNEMLMGDMPAEQFVHEGRITDAGMRELYRRLPHVRLDLLEQSRDVKDFRSVFTVEALARFVLAKLDRADRPLPAPSV